MTSRDPAPFDLAAHASFVRRLATRLCADPALGDDAAQDTLCRALVWAPARDGDPRGWLRTVLHNFARRLRRDGARRARREREAARAETWPSAEDGLERAELLQRVASAVRGLDEPYRSTILLRYYEGLPPRAIAARAGVPVETVHTRHKRALALLRRNLAAVDRDWRAGLGAFALPAAGPVGQLLGTWITIMQAKHVVAALGAALAIVLAVVWQGLGGSADAPASSPDRGHVAAAVAAAPEAVAPAAAREPVVAAAPRIRGGVRDLLGQPVAGVAVQVLGERDPFGDAPGGQRVRRDRLAGRAFATDERGAFDVELPAAGRVTVALDWREDLEVEGAGERVVDAPAENVDFVVRRFPTARLVVRAYAGAGHEPLQDFAIHAFGVAEAVGERGVAYSGGFHGARAERGAATLDLSVREPQGRRLRIELVEPKIGDGTPPPAQEVVLTTGTVEIAFALPERGVVRGRIVDGAGAPIADALVFFGEQSRARGDEPFRPIRPERIPDGARTGVDGWYELRGDGGRVTASHPSFTPATVPVAAAAQIALAGCSAIVGRLLDADGAARAGVVVQLDWRRGPTTTTAPDGAFRFGGVEAGAHAIFAGGALPVVCVRVAAGTVAEVVAVDAAGAAIAVEWADEAGAGGDGLVVGLDPVFDLRPIERGRIDGPLRPGRYWSFRRDGSPAAFEVAGRVASLRLAPGSADLVVRSAVATTVQVVPADADAIVRTVAARVRRSVEAGGSLTFRVVPGRWVVVGEAGAVLDECEVTAAGASVDLR